MRDSAAAGLILILTGLVGEMLFGALIEPLLKPFARLYDPPRGKMILALTWLLALAGVWAATQLGSDHPGVSIALATLGIPLALIATIVYRDRQRAAAGLRALNELAPGTKYARRHALLGYRKSESGDDAPAR
jgi:peptidoglycan/LPS O-acetylase OafA/YrhL